jgi:hypothetical protein
MKILKQNRILYILLVCIFFIGVSCTGSDNSQQNNPYSPYNIAVTGVTLNTVNSNICIGSNTRLSPIISPTNASNKNVTWTSSNTGVAIVDSDGIITAKSMGNTIITVTTLDGSFTANCTVIVSLKPVWANVVTYDSNSNYSSFLSITTDSDGNVYTVGSISDTGIHDFGNNIKASGTFSGYNSIIVKYNSLGKAQWAQPIVSGPSASGFTSVALDKNGNIYAAGGIYGIGKYDFGNNVTVTTAIASQSYNCVIVKYDSSGVANWAESIYPGSTGSTQTSFSSVATDTDGNIYAAGLISGTGTYNFGNGVNADGTHSGNCNFILVKYNPSGIAQWAETISSGSNNSEFNSITVDSDGNIYACGYIYGKGPYYLNNGITVNCISDNYNPILVKYNSLGEAEWVQTLSSFLDTSPWYTLSPNSSFNSIKSDSNGNIYVAGYIIDTGTYDFGNNVTVFGAGIHNNLVLLKYNSSGIAQWAKSVSTASGDSDFKSISLDNNSNVYAVGYITNGGPYNFGDGISINGAFSGGESNFVMVKYNSLGVAQWAETTKSSFDSTYTPIFNSINVDSTNNIYVTGHKLGTTSYNFGNNVIITSGYSGWIPLLVKYTGE